jgi:hypothetical protein
MADAEPFRYGDLTDVSEELPVPAGFWKGRRDPSLHIATFAGVTGRR